MNSIAFFISVGQKAADDSAELARLHDLPTTPAYLCSTHCDERFDFKAITSEEVRKVIMAMPSNKAPGYDRIPVFVIKDCLSYILPTLTVLINFAVPSQINQVTQALPRTQIHSLINSIAFFISAGQKTADDSAELAPLHDLPTTPAYLGSTHCDERFDFKAITSEEVRKVIMAMPSNKAPGYDRIPVFVIKDCLSYILPALTVLINSFFSNSVFPRAWKKSEVVPHLKDGDHEIPSNNRPISLLPVLSKVTEKIALLKSVY